MIYPDAMLAKFLPTYRAIYFQTVWRYHPEPDEEDPIMKLAVQIVLLFFAVIFGCGFIAEKASHNKPHYLAGQVFLVLLIMAVQLLWK